MHSHRRWERVLLWTNSTCRSYTQRIDIPTETKHHSCIIVIMPTCKGYSELITWGGGGGEEY